MQRQHVMQRQFVAMKHSTYLAQHFHSDHLCSRIFWITRAASNWNPLSGWAKPGLSNPHGFH
ncbi:MAG: hypothetical protein ABL878_09305, partial [Burkholderiales bacterium]